MTVLEVPIGNGLSLAPWWRSRGSIRENELGQVSKSTVFIWVQETFIRVPNSNK